MFYVHKKGIFCVCFFCCCYNVWKLCTSPYEGNSLEIYYSLYTTHTHIYIDSHRHLLLQIYSSMYRSVFQQRILQKYIKKKNKTSKFHIIIPGFTLYVLWCIVIDRTCETKIIINIDDEIAKKKSFWKHWWSSSSPIIIIN